MVTLNFRINYGADLIVPIGTGALVSPPNGSLDGVLLYRCGGVGGVGGVSGGGGRFLEMARNGTSSGAMKLKLCTGILNGSEGHL